MAYPAEERLLGILIADHIANLFNRSDIIANLNFNDEESASNQPNSDDDTTNNNKRRRITRSRAESKADSSTGDEDMAAKILAQSVQTEHCLILYYKVLDMAGTIDVCIDLLNKTQQSNGLSADDRINIAINQANDPEIALLAAQLIAASLIKDIAAYGLYHFSGNTDLKSSNEEFEIVKQESAPLPSTNVFRGIGFVAAIHQAREASMKNISEGFNTLKVVIDHVGGRISLPSIFIYRKILVELIKLVTSLTFAPVKELLYDAIGFLVVYTTDAWDVDDTGLDVVDLFLRLSPNHFPLLVSTLPQPLINDRFVHSTFVKQNYMKYLLSNFNRIFKLMSERYLLLDHVSDVIIAVHNWLRFAVSLESSLSISIDTINSLVANLVVLYVATDDLANGLLMPEIVRLLSLLSPDSIVYIFEFNYELPNMSISSELRLFGLLWASPELIAVNILLDVLAGFADSADEQFDVIAETLSQLEAKKIGKLPKFHTFYEKYVRLVELPESIENSDLFYNRLGRIFNMRKVLLPLIEGILKVSPDKRLKQLDKNIKNLKDNEIELGLFLVKANKPAKFDFDISLMNSSIYSYFALASLSGVILSLEDKLSGLALSADIFKFYKTLYDDFKALDYIGNEIRESIEFFLNDLILNVKKGSLTVPIGLKDKVMGFGETASFILLGYLSSTDTEWRALHDTVLKETASKQSGYKNTPETPNTIYRLLLLNLGSDQFDLKSFQIVSRFLKSDDVFYSNNLHPTLFVLFNRRLGRNKQKPGTDLLAATWDKFTLHVIEILDDFGINAIAQAIVYLNRVNLDSVSNYLEKMFRKYLDILDNNFVLENHMVEMVNLICVLINKFCYEGLYFSREMKNDVANVLYKCIILATENSSHSNNLTESLIRSVKILWSRFSSHSNDMHVFLSQIENRNKMSVLKKDVGRVKDLETDKVSGITLYVAFILFILQSYYFRLDKYPTEEDIKLIRLVNPPYPFIRMFVRDLCDYGNTPETYRRELGRFIDMYVAPLFVSQGHVSNDFCDYLYQFLKLRKPKLEKLEADYKLASVLNGAKRYSLKC